MMMMYFSNCSESNNTTTVSFIDKSFNYKKSVLLSMCYYTYTYTLTPI